MNAFPAETFGTTERRVAREVLSICRSRPARAMLEFAESEVVIPDGPFKGLRFSSERQPFTRLWFGSIDEGRWNRFNAVGSTQTGKTLSGSIIPCLYHLFELQENVIFGLPSMDMAGDKWREDIKPAIEAGRFRDLLPRTGSGSRDGASPTAVKFRNGVTLKFMSGGGNDKKRAGFTSRVLVVTETDGMDETGGRSREADKITQLEARTRAYGSRKRVYMECTVSVEDGRTWREHQGGTASAIILPCPKCGAWVTPERENLVGWADAETEVGAREAGAFACPECSERWSEPEREAANRSARLVHRGQEVTPEGEIVGTPTPTDTFSIRWTAANNLFVEAGDVAADEWRAARSDDADNAEKEMRQFVWALPYIPQKADAVELTIKTLMERCGLLNRGFVPDVRECVTLGADVSSRAIHWTVIAWFETGGGREVDYGTIAVDSHSLGEERAILLALRELRDMSEQGWKTPQGEEVPPSIACVDAHWNTGIVKAFCRESGAKWRPTIGFGHGQYHEGKSASHYSQPKSTGAVVRQVGDHWHSALLKKERALTWEFDADYWKSALHRRLANPAESSLALLLHKAEGRDEHLEYCRHLTAEKQVVEYVAGVGEKPKWERLRKQNHWLDSTVLALLGASIAGVRLLGDAGAGVKRKRVSLSELQAARRAKR